MERERFDDVSYHFVEEPEPPRPRLSRRARRWAVGGVAAVVVAGGLAAGASALTSAPAKAPAKSGAAGAQERSLPTDPNGFLRSGGRGCHHHWHSYAPLRPTE
jgi:hypothetical protein